MLSTIKTNFMTKEEYEKIKDIDNISIPQFFEYYKEKGGKLDDFNEFEKIFVTFTMQEAVVTGSNGKIKKITMESALNNFHNYYKEKFKLWY